MKINSLCLSIYQRDFIHDLTFLFSTTNLTDTTNKANYRYNKVTSIRQAHAGVAMRAFVRFVRFVFEKKKHPGWPAQAKRVRKRV